VTVCTQSSFEFPVANRRRVQASFTGGDVSSDGGLTLLRQADRRLKLTTTLAKRLSDPRDHNPSHSSAGDVVAATHLRLVSGLRGSQ